MPDARPTLLMTRPASASEAFVEACAARLGHAVPAVISPVLEIVDHGPVPDLGGVGTVIVTSGHAVRRLGEALRGRRVATVGAATAEAARGFGAEADALGADVEGFLASADRLIPPCLHCRGLHARVDLAGALAERGIETREAVIYDQVAVPLSAAARDLLNGGPVVIPVFSPRSAALVSEDVPATAHVTVVAISDAAADAWRGAATIRVAGAPTFGAMVDAVVATL